MNSFSSVKLKITAKNSAKQGIIDHTVFPVQAEVARTMHYWPILVNIRQELGDHLRLGTEFVL